MRTIGGNLNKLRQAMARQREYDLTTAKSITDLAKLMLDNGLLDDLSKLETKRILSTVNNAHGRQNVSGQVQKVVDVMVDKSLMKTSSLIGISRHRIGVDGAGVTFNTEADVENSVA